MLAISLVISSVSPHFMMQEYSACKDNNINHLNASSIFLLVSFLRNNSGVSGYISV